MSDSGLRDLLALTPEDELPYDENSAAVQALDLAADSLRKVRKEAIEKVALDSKARGAPGRGWGAARRAALPLLSRQAARRAFSR